MNRSWRVIWPLAILAAFGVTVRGLPEAARPAEPAIDCDHVKPGDIPTLHRCLALHPDDVEAMTELGKAYEGLRQWDKSEAAYRRALEIDPADDEVRGRLRSLQLKREGSAQ